MTENFGGVDVELTRAINALARSSTVKVRFSKHATVRMDERDIDHESVMTCLRRGKAHAPEPCGPDLRSNVVHRGIGIRVVVGGLSDAAQSWADLANLIVVTVIGIE